MALERAADYSLSRVRKPKLESLLGLEHNTNDFDGSAPSVRTGRSRSTAREGWFAQRLTVYNIVGGETSPFSSPQGLSAVAGMVADGTITARARLEESGRRCEAGLCGKALIRL